MPRHLDADTDEEEEQADACALRWDGWRLTGELDFPPPIPPHALGAMKAHPGSIAPGEPPTDELALSVWLPAPQAGAGVLKQR